MRTISFRFLLVAALGLVVSCQKERPSAPPLTAMATSEGAFIESKIDELPPAGLPADAPLLAPVNNAASMPPPPLLEAPKNPANGSQGAVKKARTGNSDDDVDDYCIDDPEKLLPGICGCGVPDEDVDNDQIFDCEDDCIDIDNDNDCAAADFCPTVPTVETIVDLGSAFITTGQTGTAGNDFTSSDTCGGAAVAPDVAFKWTAPSGGCFNLNTNGSDFDTVLHLKLASDCVTELACADGGGTTPGASSVVQSFESGEMVIIIVDGFDGEVGNFQLNISAIGCPPLNSSEGEVAAP